MSINLVLIRRIICWSDTNQVKPQGIWLSQDAFALCTSSSQLRMNWTVWVVVQQCRLLCSLRVYVALIGFKTKNSVYDMTLPGVMSMLSFFPTRPVYRYCLLCAFETFPLSSAGNSIVSTIMLYLLRYRAIQLLPWKCEAAPRSPETIIRLLSSLEKRACKQQFKCVD